MGEITDYAPLTAPNGLDQLLAIDTSDTTMGPLGSDKRLTLATLGAFIAALTGLQYLTGGGIISAATIATAQSQGYAGIYLDPRYIWDASGLVIKDVTNFVIASEMTGSIGWGGNIAYGLGGLGATGFITTSTGTPPDGIQIFSDGVAETQGIIFRNLSIVGNNPGSVVHVGGRQRDCSFPGTFVYNTNATRTTVAAGSNGVDVTTFAGAGTVNVASTTGFASSGNLVVATSVVMATLSYTGKTSTSFTGVTTLGGIGTLATGGTVGQAAFGLQVDTGLHVENSENSEFPRMRVAGANCAVGLGIGDVTQHANDSGWPGVTTAAGLVSIVALTASNMTFNYFYDRSSPALCTVANHSGVLTFITGESLNGSTSGPHDLVNTGASTVYISRTLTQVTATVTMRIAGGAVHAIGRCRWAGTVSISNGGTLNIADPAGSFATVTVSGSSGTLLLSGQYSPGAGPALSWSGTTHTSTWT